MPQDGQPISVHLFTDGACSGNPGPGGWAYILRHLPTGTEKENSGGERESTNNRMELMAVIRGLEALKRPSRVVVTTDSQYVRNGITDWIRRWRRNGGRTAAGQAVKNSDLWQRLEAVAARHEVQWRWVKGHAGHPENERADQLATGAIAMLSRPSQRS